ncbi:UDP-glucose/GDP-mannose dehydrogenase family protein [Candidatus Babeliales bacterium]|nr:UDP-glucose/GDP-mannose dehydrogenase family protein [Candidatus Babeliales bacterium]
MKRIAIVGAGYVGLVTAACFAKKGNKVVVVENNKAKLKLLSLGKPHFYEPGLPELVEEGVNSGLLTFVDNIDKALSENPEIIFSCVGTPSLADGSVDLSYVRSVAKEVGKCLNNYILFVNKSTVPVGTTKEVRQLIEKELKVRNTKITFDVASNPEFLKEGDAINDSLYPDRIVVGVSSKKSEDFLYNLYKPFLTIDDQFIVMNCESAELTKYASNAMLATRISLMNELAQLSEEVGADIMQIKKGMGYDNRIGSKFLNAGIGYGGSCFPKDVKALISIGRANSLDMNIVQSVDRVNDFQRKWFIDKIKKYFNEKLNSKKVAILGLSYKPETDDIRYAPSIDVISQMLDCGVSIIAYDPAASENVKKVFGDRIEFAVSANEALKNSDFAIVLTEWKEFKKLGIETWLLLKERIVFDARNCLDSLLLTTNGIEYFCIGRNSKSEYQPQNLTASTKKNRRIFL